LLISGEYLVLKGAKALALPVNMGQSLRINELVSSKSTFIWKSAFLDSFWFSAILHKKDFSVVKTTNSGIAEKLSHLLNAVRKLNPAFLIDRKSYEIDSHLEFHKDWGLGSSSSLVSNMAYWADVDPFLLLSETFGGSAYDIACARSNKALIYQLIDGLRIVAPLGFYPSFHNRLFFVWLGKKQNSSLEVKKFMSNARSWEKEINSISEFTEEMAASDHINDFMKLMVEHEKIMSSILRTKTVKEKYFNDFSGEIKSLGAWGGDFIMIASEQDQSEVREYFHNKGLQVFFTFKELAVGGN